MGICVIVLGESGSGKSTSLRNFEPGEIGILNVLGKPLPFRKRLDSFDNPDYSTIRRCIESGKRKVWVVDDAGYLMQNENFARAREAGFTKFTDMAVNFQSVVRAATTAQRDTITYLFMHPEADAVGNTKIKTIGKMIDEKYNLAGAVPILIECLVEDGKHVFSVKNNGHNLAKAPMGMFEEETFDNDLKAVDSTIREYWGLRPLAGTARMSGDADAD